MKTDVIKRICDEALSEGEEIREMAIKKAARRKLRINEKMPEQKFFLKHIVSLKDEPVSLDTFINFDPTVASTSGYYTLTYIPTTDFRHVKGKPYVIGQDMVRLRITVSGHSHWQMLCKRVPEFAWINRWCPQLCNGLFGLAKMHPGKNFYFAPDWISYAKLIEKKAEEQGIDLDNRPFVTYTCTRDKEKEINSTHKLAPMRTKYDVQEILDETERDETVQSEMKGED